MGWNDNYDPSEYDAADNDSMRLLAMREMMKGDPKAPPITEDSPTCWDCERKVPNQDYLHRNGQCHRCWAFNR